MLFAIFAAAAAVGAQDLERIAPPADADLVRPPRRAAPRAVPHGPPRVSSSSDDLFFGWSTGHVGSTSLSTSRAYASSATRSMRSFAFRFEILRRNKGSARFFIEANGTVAYQTDTVRAYLSSSVAKIFIRMDRASDAKGLKRVPKRAYVDFGHHSLFFIEGLLDAYPRSPIGSPRPRLVRIRRGRFETALSWCDMPGCNTLDATAENRLAPIGRSYSFSPHLSYPVRLAMPLQLWSQLTPTQKVMWYIDEVEARWQMLRAQGACANFSDGVPACVEVTWSKYVQAQGSRCEKMDTFEEAGARVAAFMGLQPAGRRVHKQPHVKSLSGKGGSNAGAQTAVDVLPDLVGQHEGYMELMRYNASTRQMISTSLDCW